MSESSGNPTQRFDASGVAAGLRTHPALRSAKLEYSTPDRPQRARLRYASPEALFRDQYEPLSRALALIAGDVHLAEEAVQEAFARLCLNWEKVSEYEDQAAWVRRVAVHRVYDHHRFFRRKARLLLRLTHSDPVAAPASPVDPRVAEAIRTLPLKQRTAVALFYLADLSLLDVAEAMAVSEGTVKRHLNRARAGLRTILEEGS